MAEYHAVMGECPTCIGTIMRDGDVLTPHSPQECIGTLYGVILGLAAEVNKLKRRVNDLELERYGWGIRCGNISLRHSRI